MRGHGKSLDNKVADELASIGAYLRVDCTDNFFDVPLSVC